MRHPIRIALVAGARPNFMKIAPLYAALRGRPDAFTVQIIHTGQHYDYKMSRVFFEDLGLPEPDAYLEVGSGLHGEQTARALSGCERYLLTRHADLVVVVGDVNSTAAAALAATKLHIPVAHVEAGLRSGDRAMPEEINRIVTDHLADILYTHCADAGDNLHREGIPAERIVFVGNVMIDTLVALLPRAAESTVLNRLALPPKSYAVLTMHRPENVDHAEGIALVAEVIEQATRRMPLVFPIHPRAAKNLAALLLRSRWNELVENVNLRLIDPLGYIDFLRLMKDARVVLTDSGGIQEETTFLGVPCLTLRENTERPITVTCGTNTIIGLNPRRVAESLQELEHAPRSSPACPPRWDGRAAARIVQHLSNYFEIHPSPATAGEAYRERVELMTEAT